jgi:hypothetical protein
MSKEEDFIKKLQGDPDSPLTGKFHTANHKGLTPELKKALGLRDVHPDEMKELPQFTPWHVTLYIRHSAAEEADLHPRVYFVRQPTASDASILGVHLWMQWENPDGLKPFPPKYPTYEDRAGMMFIDDGDYMTAWKRAQRVPGHRYIGMKANPMAFTFPGSEKFDVITWDQDKVGHRQKNFRHERRNSK